MNTIDYVEQQLKDRCARLEARVTELEMTVRALVNLENARSGPQVMFPPGIFKLARMPGLTEQDVIL